MFCKKCGKEISEEKVLCEECEIETSEDNNELVVVETEAVEAEVVEQEEVQVEDNSKKKFAVAAVVLGFCSLFIPFLNLITATLAIIFGAIGKKHDLGVVGLVSGIMFIANKICVSIMFTLYFVVYYAIAIIAILSSMSSYM